MKKLRKDIRVTQASTVSDMLVTLYKEAVAQDPEGILAKDLNLAAMMEKLKALSAEITTAIRRDKVSRSLEEADAARDKLLSRIFTVLAGYAAMPFEEKQAAAERLLAVTSKYKGIAGENYGNESALIESMLEDLGAEALAADIAALDGVGQLIAELRKAQDHFKKESVNANLLTTNKADSAFKIKKPLLAAVNEEIVPYLTGLAKTEAYKAFAAQCEIEINKANAIVTRKKPGEGDED